MRRSSVIVAARRQSPVTPIYPNPGVYPSETSPDVSTNRVARVLFISIETAEAEESRKGRVYYIDVNIPPS